MGWDVKMRRRKKYQKKYRKFLRNGLGKVLVTMGETIDNSPPHFKVKPPGTRGRPPTPPKDVVRFLLLRSLFFWSYDSIYALLNVSTCITKALGFEKIPAPTTVQGLVDKVPRSYMEELIRALASRIRRKRWNTACDGTGISIKKYKRWFDIRVHREGKKRESLKLHAMIVTLAQYPIFLSTTVTPSNEHDSPQLQPLLEKREKSVPLGNVALDKGYCSRDNAQMIADEGGTPVIALKENISPQAKGSPAWKKMVWSMRNDKRAYKNKYRRRAVIEGVIGAFKARFGSYIRSKRKHAQRIEILSRIVVWNSIAVAYHCS